MLRFSVNTFHFHEIQFEAIWAITLLLKPSLKYLFNDHYILAAFHLNIPVFTPVRVKKGFTTSWDAIRNNFQHLFKPSYLVCCSVKKTLFILHRSSFFRLGQRKNRRAPSRGTLSKIEDGRFFMIFLKRASGYRLQFRVSRILKKMKNYLNFWRTYVGVLVRRFCPKNWKITFQMIFL